MGTESIASEKAKNQDRASVPSILDEFLELQEKRPPQKQTEQRSMKTDSRGSTGNQGVTAIPRAIKHRKRAVHT